jgi:hypothetical protein
MVKKRRPSPYIDIGTAPLDPSQDPSAVPPETEEDLSTADFFG